MIVGSVTAQVEIIVPLRIFDVAGTEHEVGAMLDTGFSGSLTLPTSLVSLLGLPLLTQTFAILADGTTQTLDAYEATIIWDGHRRDILIHAIDADPLLGMKLLLGHDLRVRVIPGGSAEIESIP
jgi:clan AA aspartic protease